MGKLNLDIMLDSSITAELQGMSKAERIQAIKNFITEKISEEDRPKLNKTATGTNGVKVIDALAEQLDRAIMSNELGSTKQGSQSAEEQQLS